MLAKKFALGFGIAIILPMLVHYGVIMFNPAPSWGDYHKHSCYYAENSTVSAEEKAKNQQKCDQEDASYHHAEKIFESRLFMVAVPVGILAILIGAFSSIQAIGTGLMFGGIFSLADGYICYWSELQDWMRFFSLLVAFIVLLYIGYKKLEK